MILYSSQTVATVHNAGRNILKVNFNYNQKDLSTQVVTILCMSLFRVSIQQSNNETYPFILQKIKNFSVNIDQLNKNLIKYYMLIANVLLDRSLNRNSIVTCTEL